MARGVTGHSGWLLAGVCALLALAGAPRPAEAASGTIKSANVRLEFPGGFVGTDTMSQLQRALDRSVNLAIMDKLEGDLEFVATFEVVPDFGDVDVTKLTVVRNTAEVTDADIDQMIENLRLQRRTWNKVERAAKEGDLVAGALWTQFEDFRQPAEGVEQFSAVIGSGQLLPALESAHAIAWLLGDPPAVAAGSTVVVCLSGRGDKDVAAVAEREATVARGEA